MKQLYALLACALLLAGMAQAQDRPQGGRPGGQGGGERPEIGRITGKVVDDATGEPIEYATVALISLRDSSVATGGTTDAKGKFDISGIRLGGYTVRIDFIGYEALRLGPVVLSPRSEKGIEQDLGEVRLKSASTAMDEVEVVAERDIMEMSLDKKVFSVARNIASEGGNANDILQNIPSINVDMEGNISLRGSENVVVLIDGKPSGLTGASRQAILDQIPASTIDRIEVITNPSAKYDPDGMSGIINIVTKKNALQGMNGVVTLNAGTRDKYNATLVLGYKRKEWNFTGNYSYRGDNRFTRGESLRTNLIGDSTGVLGQDNNGRFNRGGHTAKFGVDFSPSQHSTFSASLLYNAGRRDRNETIDYRFFDPSELVGRSDRRTVAPSHNSSLDFNLGYVRTFDKPGKELAIDLRHSRSAGDASSQFENRTLLLDGTFDGSEPAFLQRNATESSSGVTTLQLDYVNPLSKVAKWELGYKSILRGIDEDFRAEDFDDELGQYVNDANLTNNFEYREDIHAAYGIYSRTLGKLSVQAGLRLEQTLVDALLVTTGQRFENDYFSAFPSGYLNYAVSESDELRFGYSRRINRPRTRQINPFVNLSDPFNIQVGNPFLLPEYVDAYEVSYSKNWKQSTFSASAYWRETHDMVQRVARVDDQGVSVTTFENLLGGRTYGLELVFNAKPAKWWSLNLSGNMFQSVIDGSNVEADLNNEAFSYSGKVLSTFTLPKSIQVQVSSNYRAPFASAQGEIRAFYSTDIAASMRVLDGKGTLTVRVSDIFDQRQFGFTSAGANFFQEGIRKWESRIGYISFSYRFGKLERERRRMRRDRGGEGFDGGDMDMD